MPTPPILDTLFHSKSYSYPLQEQEEPQAIPCDCRNGACWLNRELLHLEVEQRRLMKLVGILDPGPVTLKHLCKSLEPHLGKDPREMERAELLDKIADIGDEMRDVHEENCPSCRRCWQCANEWSLTRVQ